ncbi:plastocyanin/azurin family copper-binding protein [Paraconexibacter sp.]|uniref:cupredoxin domain-containing protein n=1 Tax=Paraconexibacter sp. TaxID=2949640 RepID=UPI00356B58A1
MIGRGKVGLLLAGVVLAGAVLPSPAGAVNRRVAIGDFQWSPREVVIDLNEKVTWTWVGPDTQHSVGPVSGNTSGVDSDPGNAAPDHFPGFEFTAQFTRPGSYEFVCKLHAIVRGRVVVTATPGNPDLPSPDPQPVVTVDLRAPELTEVRWVGSNRLRGGRGTLAYTLDERATLVMDVEKRVRGRWRLAGTRRFDGHVGWNEYDFAGVLNKRRLGRGTYRALIVAADAENNRTRDVLVPFRVR